MGDTIGGNIYGTRIGPLALAAELDTLVSPTRCRLTMLPRIRSRHGLR